MKVIKQSASIFLFLSFIIACNQEEKKEPVEETIKPRDSVTSTVPENTTVNTYASVDISPMDMSYFPVDYPKNKNGQWRQNSPTSSQGHL